MPDSSPAQGGAPAAGAPAPVSTAVSRTEVNSFIQQLIGRYGTVEAALQNLAGDQLKYRKRAQKAEATAADLQKKVPAADAVVLTGDAAKVYNELVKSGVDLAKVPESLTELTTLKTKDSKAQKESALTVAAGDKYKPKILSKILGDTPIELKKVNVRGKDDKGEDTITEEQVAYVVLGEGAAQTRELLDTYLEREHADWMDVLTVPESERGSNNATTETRRQSGGSSSSSTVSTTRQTPVGGKPSGGKPADDMAKVVDKTLGSKYVSPSQRNKKAAGTE